MLKHWLVEFEKTFNTEIIGKGLCFISRSELPISPSMGLKMNYYANICLT